MDREQWLTLPEPVQDFVWYKLDNLNQELGSQFGLNTEQLDFISDLEDRLFLKRMDVLDLPQRLASLPQATSLDLRVLSLEIATRFLWPLQDYLSNIDRLILRLGGKVPLRQHLKGTLNQAKTFPSETTGMVRQLLIEYADFKDLRLSGKKIYGNDGRFLTPTLDNWLKDYVHFLGAGYHNSLQRAQYLAKAPNSLGLSSEERESLRNILMSYDDNIILWWQVADSFLTAKLIAKPADPANKKIDLEIVVKNLEKNLKQVEEVVLPTDFIMSEAGNDLFKLRDVLWQALGMQDRTKILTCLKVLAERKVLDSMLTEDNRFKSILKRFLTVRYGNSLNNWLENNQDKLISRRLFFELVLEEKMNLAEDESTVAAFYLTNVWPKSGQVVYLDQQDGRLKWRGLQVINNQLAWIE